MKVAPLPLAQGGGTIHFNTYPPGGMMVIRIMSMVIVTNLNYGCDADDGDDNGYDYHLPMNCIVIAVAIIS